MGFAHWLVVLSVFVSFVGGTAYIRDTLAGKTKPNRVTWFMWALAPFIVTGVALYAHADAWATVRTFQAGFIPLLIFFASFVNKQSYWRLTLFDFLCGVFSVAALIIWGITDSPQTAILLVVIGDGFASLPTIVKAWKYPETETAITYLASFVAVLLIIPSIPKWNIENSAFQIYLLIANSFLLLAIWRRYLGWQVKPY